MRTRLHTKRKWLRRTLGASLVTACGILAAPHITVAETPAPAPAASSALAPRPNIVVIVGDDNGYHDFGFQGSKDMQTPAIDQLARDGVIYTDAYATMPFCSPSRAGLMTGRYTQRFGYEYNLTEAPKPWTNGQYMGLDVHQKTMGTRFQAAGYDTIAIGKWHLGSLPQFRPNKRGFDHFYGFLGGSSHYFPQDIPAGTILQDDTPVTPKEYLTDQFGAEAIKYVKQSQGKPFLLYLAFNAVHTPMDATGPTLKRFAYIKDPQRRRLVAETWSMDSEIGKLMQTLKDMGQLDNTMVVFTVDNGGDRIGIGADNAPLRGTKGTMLEGGIRVPLIVRYPHAAHAGTRMTAPVSLMDILPTALQVAHVPLHEQLDGMSLLANSPGKFEQRPLFWRYGNQAAMQQGNWKLIRFPDRPDQLYNLANDIGERQDLARAYPMRLRAMLKELFHWEAGLETPRWDTGTYWWQEDVHRYSENVIERENAKEKAHIVAEDKAAAKAH